MFGQAFTEGFEGGSVTGPTGTPGVSTWSLTSTASLGTWATINVAGPNISWQRQLTSTSGPQSATGSYFAYLDSETLPGQQKSEDWLITPRINMAQMYHPVLTFKTTNAVPDLQDTEYKVLISENPIQTNRGAFTLVKDYNEVEISSGYVNFYSGDKSLNIPEYYRNKQVYIAFVMKGNNQDKWLLDDISLSSYYDGVKNLDITNLRDTSVSFSWNLPEGATNAEIYIDSFGAPSPTTGTTVNNSFTTSVNGQGVSLIPGEAYRVNVRAVYSNGSKSPWYNSIFVMRRIGELCENPLVIPPALPYRDYNLANVFPNRLYYENAFTQAGCGSNMNISWIYSYTPATNTTVNVKINCIPGLSLFVYNSCNALGQNCMASDTNVLSTVLQVSELSLQAGQTYYIVVANKDKKMETVRKYYSLLVTESSPCTSPPQADFSLLDGSAGTLISDSNIQINVTNMGGASSLVANVNGLMYSGNNTQPLVTTTITSTGTVNITVPNYTGDLEVVLSNPLNPKCFIASDRLVHQQLPPVNDECLNAKVISSNSYTDFPSFKDATLSNSLFSGCNTTPLKDVWYEFKATNTKAYVHMSDLNTVVSDQVMRFALYSGTCGALTQISCSDDSKGILNNLIVGETYKIRVFNTADVNSYQGYGIMFKFSQSNICEEESETVRTLFADLINYLLMHRDEIPSQYLSINNNNVNNPDYVPNTGFDCPALQALAPYITVANPKIYNLGIYYTDYSNGRLPLNPLDKHLYQVIRFDFSPNSYGPSGLHDVELEYTNSSFISDYILWKYNGVEGLGAVGIYNYGEDILPVTGRETIKKIKFCPDEKEVQIPPCASTVTGNISYSTGQYCTLVNQPVGFIFNTSATNVVTYDWLIRDFDGNTVFSSHNSSPTFTFTSVDSYFMELTITTTDNCRLKFYKNIMALSSCNSCAESDPQSLTVKNLYLALINKLLALYPEHPVTTPFTCPELVALSPYLADPSALIYNINYTNNVLSFSFGNHVGYDVSVTDRGVPMIDMSLYYYTSPQVAFSSGNSIYQNGQYGGTHSVKQVNFCSSGASQCPPLTVAVLIAGHNSCVTKNVSQEFYFETTATNIQNFTWRFYALNNTTVLLTSTESHPVYTYTAAGTYKIKLDVTYNNGCTASFTRTVTVSDVSCESYCTETNNVSAQIKNSYKQLLNYIISIYHSNGSIANGTTRPELTQLMSYLPDADPKLYNVIFNHTNRTIKFSLGNHGTDYDVFLQLPSTLYPFVNDINIMNYQPATAGLQSFVTTFTDGSTTTSHQVRHINFCPGIECSHLIGSIVLDEGTSCMLINDQQKFKLQAPVQHISSYMWYFYNQAGNLIGTPSSLAEPTMTYHQAGTYKVVLTITEDTGCKSTYTKIITVSTDCGTVTQNPGGGSDTVTVCTEVNDKASTVRGLYISLLNHLISLGTAPPSGYVCNELTELTPYINQLNPRIYNATLTNQTLSFSFTQNQSQPDVVVRTYGQVTDLNLYNYTTDSVSTSIWVGYSDGTMETSSVKKVVFCPAEPPCKSHIAFVIDESSSISEEDAYFIKAQLSAFVTQQAQMHTATTISFIGMSDSDDDKRTDHVYKTINGPADLAEFQTWIANYKSGYSNDRRNMGISPNSDYWASGLKRAMRSDIYLNPDIVIVITDGSQTKNLQGLKNIIAQVNQYSHLYVYGIGTGYYVDLDPLTDPNNAPLSEVSGHLKTSLKYLLNLPSLQFPVSDQSKLLVGTYYEYPDFRHMGADLRYFSDKIAKADIGCEGDAVPKVSCNDCQTFQPYPQQKYWLSAWVKEEQNIQVKTYANATVKLIFEEAQEEISSIDFFGSGDIIDGWQRIAGEFTIPEHTSIMKVELLNQSQNIPVYFDDIRIIPLNGSMKSYVYDSETFKLMAELDDNNYSTIYEYDKEGSLIRVKKETAQGIKTINESRSGNVIQSTQN